MDRPIVTRAEAKELGLKRYFTGKPCKHGHVAERYTLNGNCLDCLWLDSQTPERKATKAAGEQVGEGKAAKKARNDKRYHDKPHLYAARRVHARSPDAIVPLTESEQASLRWFYAAAKELSTRSGVLFHVDHCYPLNLGGIHHPLNVMILPARLNVQKSSKYQPDNPLAVRGLHLAARLSLRIQQP